MAEFSESKGRCLCGAVQVSVTTRHQKMAACHCNTCLTWGGGPMLALEGIEDARFEGEENITVYASSEWAERGFCRHCGTHLFYRLTSGEHLAIPVGLVDGGEPWELTEQIFIDRKPGFYAFANRTRDLTGDEVMAMFDEAR